MLFHPSTNWTDTHIYVNQSKVPPRLVGLGGSSPLKPYFLDGFQIHKAGEGHFSTGDILAPSISMPFSVGVWWGRSRHRLTLLSR